MPTARTSIPCLWHRRDYSTLAPEGASERSPDGHGKMLGEKADAVPCASDY